MKKGKQLVIAAAVILGVLSLEGCVVAPSPCYGYYCRGPYYYGRPYYYGGYYGGGGYWRGPYYGGGGYYHGGYYY